jgi:CheY-like chemotaxis protein
MPCAPGTSPVATALNSSSSSLNPAEERLRSDPAIDVLMLDLSLPDRDGIEFLTLLKASASTAS